MKAKRKTHTKTYTHNEMLWHKQDKIDQNQFSIGRSYCYHYHCTRTSIILKNLSPQTHHHHANLYTVHPKHSSDAHTQIPKKSKCSKITCTTILPGPFVSGLKKKKISAKGMRFLPAAFLIKTPAKKVGRANQKKNCLKLTYPRGEVVDHCYWTEEELV